MRKVIDLHTHTTASDGSLRPSGLIKAAADAGLSAVAVTDHDSVAGVGEALRAGGDLGIEVVPGVEVSAEHSPGQMHIVGLFIDHDNQDLTSWLSEIRGGRDTRNPRIIARLNELGVDISMEEVTEAAGDGSIGRPHIACVMVEKGFVSNTQEAFDRYLAKGAPAYFDRLRATAEESIRKIHSAGGVAILAHPNLCGARSADELRSLVERLKAGGLDGIEVFYSTMSPEDERLAESLAREFGLLRSGGTDFHGASKPEIRLGIGTGNLAVPHAFLEALRKNRSDSVD